MTRKITQCLKPAAVLLLAVALTACDSDSPTAPSVTVTAAPNPMPSASWTVTVTASFTSIGLDELLELGGATARITVTARRSDNGQVPPTGATAILSATDGTLTSGASSGTEIPVAFDSGGRAVAELELPAQAVSIVVQARLEQNVGQVTVRVLEAAAELPLFIESIVPSSGPPSGGTQVRIQGSGFDPPVRVSFGGIFADVLSVQPNLIVVSSPPVDLAVGGTSTVPVTVSINVNDPEDPPGSDTLANAFTYARAGETLSPSIISVSPTFGPNEGGTQVTIFGENFASAVQVFFGTSALIEAPVISVSPTRLVVETPSATGPNSVNQNTIVGIRVVNVASGAFATLGGAYQYGAPGGGIFISSAGPTEGFYFGGLNVTIFGQGFDEPVAVGFGGFAQQVISVSGTEIIARSVPVDIESCLEVSGDFSVTNIETGESAGSNITFIYRTVDPVIANISPAEVEIVVASREIVPSGATSTISGGGFDFPVRVTFGDDAAAIVDGTVVLDPAFDPRYGIGSAFDVVVPRYLGAFPSGECTDAFGNAGTILQPARVDVTVLNLPTECPDTFTNGFTYVPVQDAAGTPVECQVDGNAPTASFSFAVDVETVTFSDTSTDSPTSWSWDFGDGTGSTLQNPVHTYPPGVATYTVTLVAANDFGPSAPFTATVTTAPQPPPVASYIVTVSDQTAVFTDTSTGGPTSWQWNFGDGTTSSDQHPVHLYPPVTATYNVTLVASNAFGSSAPFTTPVTIIAPPVPTASFTSAVDDLTATFTDTSTGSPTAWSWDFGDGGTSTSQNPVHVYPQVAATYDVTLVASNAAGDSAPFVQQVTITPQPPVANFSFAVNNLTANFTDLSTGNPTSWLWDFGDSTFSTAQNPVHVYPPAVATYNVTLVATNAFGSSVPFTRQVTIVP